MHVVVPKPRHAFGRHALKQREQRVVYEPDMTIVFDALTRTCVVSFRGLHKILAGPYDNREQAVLAGEAYCRTKGWGDCPAGSAGSS
jgi:hypothetical protein